VVPDSASRIRKLRTQRLYSQGFEVFLT